MKAFSIHQIYRRIFKIWREKRFQVFVDRIHPHADEAILDVGGYPGNWVNRTASWARVDALNIHCVEWEPSSAPGHHIRALMGDGCQLDFPDSSYEIVFSNSVIEHVGDWERQQAFASEVRRVGKKLWIQTPAWECPVEPHYLAPLIHYLPKGIRRRVVRWITPWGIIQKPSKEQIDAMVDTTRLLRKKEMETLFPDCDIITEYLLGIIPKSYIAIRGGDRRAASVSRA